MAATKADTLKQAGELDAKLKGKMFLGGNKPSAEDVKAFEALLGKGNTGIFRWVKNLASFTEAERKAFGAPVKITPPVVVVKEEAKKEATAVHTAKPAAPAAAAAPAAKKEEPKKAAPAPAPAADDDDEDLFGEETEEEKAALEAKKKADADKAKAKKEIIAKSSILIDVKPWEDTTDLEALALKIKAVEKDGLLWGAHKLVPIAYGVKKLQLLFVIEDDKVSSEDIEDIITGQFEDEVQSMDIVAWNKI